MLTQHPGVSDANVVVVMVGEGGVGGGCDIINKKTV